jgi:hypothetical protein
MKGRVIQSLGIAIASVIINLVMLPAYAAPGDAKDGEQASKPVLPDNIRDIALVGAGIVVIAAVVVGTGKSIKYHENPEEDETLDHTED